MCHLLDHASVDLLGRDANCTVPTATVVDIPVNRTIAINGQNFLAQFLVVVDVPHCIDTPAEENGLVYAFQFGRVIRNVAEETEQNTYSTDVSVRFRQQMPLDVMHWLTVSPPVPSPSAATSAMLVAISDTAIAALDMAPKEFLKRYIFRNGESGFVRGSYVFVSGKADEVFTA